MKATEPVAATMPTNSRRAKLHPAAWLAALATLLAAALRFIVLGALPPQAWHDEIWFALRARELLDGAPWVAHYGIENTAGNAGLAYLTALVRWLGVESPVSARAAAALAGTLAVPLAYACFKRLFHKDFPTRRAAMAAIVALILAGTAFLIILGRVGMEPALLPPVALFAAWLVAAPSAPDPFPQVAGNEGWLGGSQTRPYKQLTRWGAAGLALGLAQYNGPHGRFVLPLVGYFWLEDLFERRAGTIPNVKSQLSNALAFTIPFALATVPLAMTFIAHPDYFTGRALMVAEGVSLPENALKTLGAFTFAGDLNPRHNLPAAPMFDPILAAGFGVGLLWALFNLRRRLARSLIVWLILMSVPSALTAEAPNFGRMIGAAAPAAALAVIGWANVLDWLSRRSISNIEFRISNWLAPTLISGSLAWNLYQVFGLWAASPDLAGAFTAKAMETGRELARRAESGEAVYVDRRLGTLDVAAFEYLFEGTSVRRIDFRECWPVAPLPATGLALADSGAPLAGKPVDLGWQGVFVEGDLTGKLPADSARTARFDKGIAIISAPPSATAPTLSIQIALLATAPASRDWSYFVHIQPAGAEGQPPLAQADGQPCGGLYPLSRWRPGEGFALPPIVIALPDNLPPQAYEAVFGLYDAASGERATLLSAERPLPDNRAILFDFEIP